VEAVGGESEDGVDVVFIVDLLALSLLLFLLAGHGGCRGDFCGALAEHGVGVHAVDRVQVPDLNVRVHGADGDEVCLLAFGDGLAGLGNGHVEPFDG
jgi:hypothetical protein